MTSTGDTAALTADARLDEVARILAEAILRARHRRILKRIPSAWTTEKQLELCASARTHGPRNGAHP